MRIGSRLSGAWLLRYSLFLSVAGSSAFVSAVQAPPAADEGPSRRHYEQGLSDFKAGRVASAIRELRLAVRYSPKWPQAHNSLGLAFHQSGQVDAAVVEFRKTIALK